MSKQQPFHQTTVITTGRKTEGRKKRSFIGIPKETSYQERRICLTPDAVNSLSSMGIG
jgi:alanine dehydrogenase